MTAKKPGTAILFPSYAVFKTCCAKGLSAIYPFTAHKHPDLYGWKYGTRWPPSYNAFGTMRTLLAIRDALDLNPKIVLEVAGGEGGLAATLAREGCRVTINDLRTDLTREALKEYTNGEQITLIGGDMFDLPVARLGQFDLVIASEIIEHVAHPDALLKHLKTFLKPEGSILLTTPNGSYFRNKLPTHAEIKNFTELEMRQFRPDADGHLFLITPHELCRLAEKIGLQVERLSVWGTPLLTGHMGLRIFRTKYLAWSAYQTERFTQQLPQRAREKLCAGMTAILSTKDCNSTLIGRPQGVRADDPAVGASPAGSRHRVTRPGIHD